MVLTFPAAYHNRNVIFFNLMYIALLWLIHFSSPLRGLLFINWPWRDGRLSWPC